jgi:uncharacterized protein YutE (UPF0331/DUF86 family)
VVDRAVLAHKIAAVRDAVERIRAVLPAEPRVFAADRTAREVVVLNLFVALQECLDLASHWLADAGWDVPASFRDVYVELAERGVIDEDLAGRMASATGLRNLIAHRYAALDWLRVHEIASGDLADLLAFCQVLAREAGG